MGARPRLNNSDGLAGYLSRTPEWLFGEGHPVVERVLLSVYNVHKL